MGLVRGLFVRKDATRGTTPVEARKALAGLFTPAGAFGARPGVLSGLTVTGTAGWTYALAAGHHVTSRGVSDGVVLAANDGAATVATTAAPGTGGRIDLIWVKHSDVDAGDPTADNVFGVTAGVVSGSPAVPALPVGAMELAQAKVMAGATSTSHANVTITNTAQRTGLRGGIIEVPDAAARVALGNPPAGNGYYVHEYSTNILWRNIGTAWEQIYPLVLPVIPDTGWITPALGGGWVNFGAGFQTVRYRRLDGRVYIEGTIKSGTAGVFTLPIGFRPTNIMLYVGTANAGLSDVRIYPSGTVEVAGYNAGGSNPIVSFNQVRFFAEA